MLLFGAVAADAGVRGVAATPSTAIVKTAFNEKLKQAILVDGAGRTPQGPYGAECPAIGPPLTSAGAPRAGGGVNPSPLGIYERLDGKRQARCVAVVVNSAR